MSGFNKIFTELVNSFSRFPGIGRRSAERIVFYLLKMPADQLNDLAAKISEIPQHLKPCGLCNNFSSGDLCSVCADTRRDKEVICIVEEPKDIIAVEKTSHFNGQYYVLLGAVSPVDGINGEDLNVGKLLYRLQKGEIKEVIIATDPDTDGELTAQYLIEKISSCKVKIYRIAIGVPMGTQIEYIDSGTLGKAILDKKELKGHNT